MTTTITTTKIDARRCLWCTTRYLMPLLLSCFWLLGYQPLSLAQTAGESYDTRTEIDADEVISDEVNLTYRFAGNVKMVETSPTITTTVFAEELVIEQDQDGYRNGKAKGSGQQQIRIERQGKLDSDTLIARCDQVIINGKTAIWELVGNAYLKSGNFEAYGASIIYDSIYGRMQISHKASDNVVQTPTKKGRVRLIINPVDQ